MSERKPWSYTAGSGDSRVVVEENKARGGKLQLRWWDRTKTPPNWKREVLDRLIERDLRGKITADCEAYAIAAAQQKSLEMAGRGAASSNGKSESKPVTISEAEALITNAERGKYPHRNQFRDELVRALRLACALWGAKTPWRDIEESHYTMLLRSRLEGLVANNKRAVRATEISVSRLITVVKWLRSAKHIPREAAPWPEDWKEDIVKHWKGVTKSAEGPEPFQPRFTLDESQRILRASGFDPRWELLMWLGMDLRLGQVARAKRSHVDLTTGDELAAGDFGRFTVHGAGKKGGTVVALTKGQRDIIDRTLAGYLSDLEAQFQSGDIENYLLFPAGYVVGRVARTRGKESELSLGKKISRTKHVSGSWIRKNFLVAEKAAGVEHVPGRGAYGVRRQSVDVGASAQLSQYGLQALGGWSDTKIPLTVYAERSNKAGQLEARPVRATLRGEKG